ncbi:MAG: DNA mismatch repair endonuclease MutL [Thermacetogeniaceae bacterium]
MRFKMGRISILNPEIIHQIAAGEVVERPASVVKELLENSIDAGANQITIKIIEAGLKEIKVIDNGSGMTKDDAILALERHATSKITSIEDLNCLRTLGFRGEALPAIAAVSRFTLITRTPEEISGIKLIAIGGKIESISSIGCPPGTQVTVKDLFYNTPARRKFLKSLKTEAATISDVITRFALGYPEISFRYYSGNQLRFATNGQGNLLDVLGIIYGNDAIRNFIELSFQEKGIQLYGFISLPKFCRANRSHQSFFVNRRLVYNSLLNHSIENAYRGLIPKGLFPIVVLFITLDPSTVDVNVHPTKREIRFSNPTLIADTIQQGVRNALITHLASQKFLLEPKISSISPITSTENNDKDKPTLVLNTAGIHEEKTSYSYIRETLSFQEQKAPFNFQSLHVIGQALGSYIVAEGEGEIYFIDQHAAHERIRYESIKKAVHNKKGIPFHQKLISPIELRLTPQQREIYEEYKNFIASLGYTLKESPNGTISILAVPVGLVDNPEAFLVEILDFLQENVEIERMQPETVREKATILFACKSAIKAGDRLNIEEMQGILEQLDKTEQPETCPHGRPTYFKITDAELRKKFHRT